MKNEPAKPKAAPKAPKKSSPIKAVAAYSPRIKQEKTIQINTMVNEISGRSSINEGTVINVLRELFWVVNHHLSNGQAVNIDALGTLTPQIALDGSFSVSYLPSIRLKAQMKSEKWFQGDIKNSDMIGKTVQDLVDRWNSEHQRPHRLNFDQPLP